MRADQLVQAVVAAMAVVCLLVAGRVDGLDDYVPAAAASKEVEPQNPGHYLPGSGFLPLPPHLFSRPFGGGGYVPQTEVAPEVTTHAGATLSGSLGGGYFPQPEQTTEPAPEQTNEPQPEQTTEPPPEQTPTTEPEAHTADQGDFYRTGETPTEPEPPATPTTPQPGTPTKPKPVTPETPTTPETPATPSAPEQQSTVGGYAGGGANKQVDDDGEPVDGLSPKAIDNILKEHNEFRAKEHVPPLTWNATVAKYAQQYANERKGDCALKHSTGPYGENLMYGEGKAWTWRHTVDEWSDEKKNYHYGSNTCDAGKQCGHYTAVVWKGTTAVGCGRVTCTTGDTLMVCSYYPPGNYEGEKPY